MWTLVAVFFYKTNFTGTKYDKFRQMDKHNRNMIFWKFRMPVGVGSEFNDMRGGGVSWHGTVKWHAIVTRVNIGVYTEKQS